MFTLIIAKYLTSYTETIPLVEGSHFDQMISAGSITFSERDLGILQQGPLQDDCRSVLENDDYCRSFVTEILAPGTSTCPKSSWQDDQQEIICRPGEQNSTPGLVNTTSHLPYNKDINVHDDSLNHIAAELAKKRQELAAAEVLVSKLSTEVKLLEQAFGEQKGHHPIENVVEVTPKPKTSHKRGSDGTDRNTKRRKGKADAQNLDPDYYLPDGESEGYCLQTRHNHALNNTSPTIVDSEGGKYIQSLVKNSDAITSSKYAAVTVIGSSPSPEACFSQAVQNPGDSLSGSSTYELSMISQHFDKSDVTQSLSIQKPWRGLQPRDPNNSMLESISGFTFQHSGQLNCRASSMGVMEELDDSIIWVA